MTTYSIIIQDSDNKIFQRMSHISGPEEEKVTNNIAKLQSIRTQLNMHTTDHNADVNYLLQKNWVESQTLYDGLILEYNNQPGMTNFLRAY